MSDTYYFWLALLFFLQTDQQELYLRYKSQTAVLGKYNFSFLLFMKWTGEKV